MARLAFILASLLMGHPVEFNQFAAKHSWRRTFTFPFGDVGCRAGGGLVQSDRVVFISRRGAR